MSEPTPSEDTSKVSQNGDELRWLSPPPTPKWVFVPALAGVASIPACAAIDQGGGALFAVWGACVLAATLGGVVVIARSPEPARGKAVASAVLGTMGAMGSLIYGMSHFSITRGRQLFTRGVLGGQRPVRPERAPLAHTSSLEARAAARWIENADAEWVSVAAFSKLAMDLLVVGAPPPLVRACHESALEEVLHAELCFEIAASLDPGVAREARPAPVPALVAVGRQAPTLASLATDSFVQGAWLEDVSSRVAATLAERALAPRIREILEMIEEDERRHAEHAWGVVDFCLEHGGADVRAALAGCLPLRAQTRAAPDQDLEDLGIMSEAVQRAAESESALAATARLEAALS